MIAPALYSFLFELICHAISCCHAKDIGKAYDCNDAGRLKITQGEKKPGNDSFLQLTDQYDNFWQLIILQFFEP
jgi:hypothetical protein